MSDESQEDESTEHETPESVITTYTALFEKMAQLKDDQHDQITDELFNIGLELLDHKEFEKSEHCFKEIIPISSHPSTILSSYVYLTQSQLNLNKLEEAKSGLTKILAILDNPEDYRHLSLDKHLRTLGNLFFKSKVYHEACLCYENALRFVSDIEPHELHHSLAETISMEGKWNRIELATHHFLKTYEFAIDENNVTEIINIFTSLNNHLQKNSQTITYNLTSSILAIYRHSSPPNMTFQYFIGICATVIKNPNFIELQLCKLTCDYLKKLIDKETAPLDPSNIKALKTYITQDAHKENLLSLHTKLQVLSELKLNDSQMLHGHAIAILAKKVNALSATVENLQEQNTALQEKVAELEKTLSQSSSSSATASTLHHEENLNEPKRHHDEEKIDNRPAKRQRTLHEFFPSSGISTTTSGYTADSSSSSNSSNPFVH